MCIYKLGGLVQQLAEGRERRTAPNGPNPVDLALEVDGIARVLRRSGRPVDVPRGLDAVQRRQQELERVPGLEVHIIKRRQSLDVYDIVADVALARVNLLHNINTRVAEDGEDLAEHARAVLVDDADALDRV